MSSADADTVRTANSAAECIVIMALMLYTAKIESGLANGHRESDLPDPLHIPQNRWKRFGRGFAEALVKVLTCVHRVLRIVSHEPHSRMRCQRPASWKKSYRSQASYYAEQSTVLFRTECRRNNRQSGFLLSQSPWFPLNCILERRFLGLRQRVRPQFSPSPLPRQHELISLWVDAHCQMRRLISFGLRFSTQPAATGYHFLCAGNHVRHLKS